MSENIDIISAVVLTYNASDTVIRTLDSIAAQTWKEIELIITDDHSSDNTVEIVKDWIYKNETRFLDVRLIESPVNTGVSGNCNRGIKVAKGYYIYRIAGDDELLPYTFSEEIQFLRNNKKRIAFARVEVCGTDKVLKKTVEDFCENSYRIISGSHELHMNRVMESSFVCGPSQGLAEKSLYEELGYLDENYPAMEDYPFIYKLIKSGFDMPFINKVMAKYYLTDKSSSTLGKDGFSLSNERFRKCSQDFFVRVQLQDLIKAGNYEFIAERFNWYHNQEFNAKMLERMLILRDKNKNMSCLFEKRKISTVAVYGMGKVGMRLYSGLKREGINIAYCIDKHPEAINVDVPIYSLDSNLPQVEAIVITIRDYDMVEERLSKLVNCLIISVVELLHYANSQ